MWENINARAECTDAVLNKLLGVDFTMVVENMVKYNDDFAVKARVEEGKKKLAEFDIRRYLWYFVVQRVLSQS